MPTSVMKQRLSVHQDHTRYPPRNTSVDSYGCTMLAMSRIGWHGISGTIYSCLIQWQLPTVYNSSWCGRTAGAGEFLSGSGRLPSAHIWGKCFTKPATKWTIWDGTTPVPFGMTSITPIRRQPAQGRFNAQASISLCMVAMISGQRLSRQAAGITSQRTSWPRDHWIRMR